MRVSSRRLRAAMDAFEGAFPRKTFRPLLRQVKEITDVLGDARDLDVAIERLSRLVPEIARRRAPGHRGPGRALPRGPRRREPARSRPSSPASTRSASRTRLARYMAKHTGIRLAAPQARGRPRTDGGQAPPRQGARPGPPHPAERPQGAGRADRRGLLLRRPGGRPGQRRPSCTTCASPASGCATCSRSSPSPSPTTSSPSSTRSRGCRTCSATSTTATSRSPCSRSTWPGWPGARARPRGGWSSGGAARRPSGEPSAAAYRAFRRRLEVGRRGAERAGVHALIGRRRRERDELYARFLDEWRRLKTERFRPRLEEALGIDAG